jgi:hypothetical protein
MVTPRKPNPSQRGRKLASKAPMFGVVDQQNNKNDNGKLLKFLDYFDDAGITPVSLTNEQMRANNIAALKQALQLTLEDPERRDQITEKLKSEEWGDVAQFCAYSQQIDALDLRPWQTPPSMLEMDADKFDDILAKRDPIGNYATVLLTTKLIRHGVSVYSPDPITALNKAVKQSRRGRRRTQSMKR